MIKLSNENKKLLVILLLIFTTILVVILIDLLLNIYMKSQPSNTTPNYSENEVIGEDSTDQQTSKQSRLKRAISEIFDLMNAKDFEKLYSLLSDEYKESAFNNSFDKFSKFMTNYCDDKYVPVFDSYSNVENVYIVPVKFMLESISNDYITEYTSAKKSDTFTITFLANDTYKFSFSKFIGEKKLNESAKNEDIKVELTKSILYDSESEFYISITNNSDKTIDITDKNIYCFTGIKQRFYKDNFSIPPHTVADVRFVIPTGLSIRNALPDKIYFNDILVGEKKHSLILNVKYFLDR